MLIDRVPEWRGAPLWRRRASIACPMHGQNATFWSYVDRAPMFSSGSRDTSRFIHMEEVRGSADGYLIISDVLFVFTPWVHVAGEFDQIPQFITSLFGVFLRSLSDVSSLCQHGRAGPAISAHRLKRSSGVEDSRCTDRDRPYSAIRTHVYTAHESSGCVWTSDATTLGLLRTCS